MKTVIVSVFGRRERGSSFLSNTITDVELFLVDHIFSVRILKDYFRREKSYWSFLCVHLICFRCGTISIYFSRQFRKNGLFSFIIGNVLEFSRVGSICSMFSRTMNCWQFQRSTVSIWSFRWKSLNSAISTRPFGFCPLISIRFATMNKQTLFRFVTALTLSVEHGISSVRSGYSFNVKFESNFPIEQKTNDDVVSYFWNFNDTDTKLLQIQWETNLFRVFLRFSFFFNFQNKFRRSEKRRKRRRTRWLLSMDSFLRSSFVFVNEVQRVLGVIDFGKTENSPRNKLISIDVRFQLRVLPEDPRSTYRIFWAKNSFGFEVKKNEKIVEMFSVEKNLSMNGRSWKISTVDTNFLIDFVFLDGNRCAVRLSDDENVYVEANGSFRLDGKKLVGIDFQQISPEIFGEIFLTLDENLRLEGKDFLRSDWTFVWKNFREKNRFEIDFQLEQKFFFFKENFRIFFLLDRSKSIFNLTAINTDRLKFVLFFDNNSFHHRHFVSFNTSIVEFFYGTEVKSRK